MTVDNTGAQWCYVDSSHSSCQDLVPSQRFPHNPWSYEACATPALGSPICPNYPAYPSHPTYPHPALAQPTNVYSPPHGPIVAPAGPVQGVPALPLGPIIGNGALPLGPTLGGGSLPLGPALGGGSGPLGPAFGGGSLPLGPNLGGGSLPFGPAFGGGSSPLGPALGGGSFPLGPEVGGPFLGDARQGPVVEGKGENQGYCPVIENNFILSGTASKLNFKQPTK